MKRIEIIKKAIENNTYKDIELKKTDIDILFNLFAAFLESRNYPSATAVKEIFDSGQIDSLFTLINKHGDLDIYQEPENWQEISDKFDEIRMLHFNKIIDEDNFDNFIDTLNLPFAFPVNEESEHPFCPVRYSRQMFFKSYMFLSKILHEKGKDAWILYLLEKITSSRSNAKEQIMRIIEKTLINSKKKVLKKASIILINYSIHIYNENNLNIGFSDHFFNGDTKLILQTKQYLPLHKLLIKMEENGIREPLFNVESLIYKHNTKLFHDTLCHVNSRKKKYIQISLTALRICRMNNDVENNLFIIDQIESYIAENYTKNILEKIDKHRKIVKLEKPQSKPIRRHCKDWWKLYKLNYVLIDATINLFLSSLISSYIFDLIDFINKYNLDYNVIIRTLFRRINFYRGNNEYVFSHLNEYFSSILNSNKISQESKLLICNKSLVNLFGNNIPNLNKFRKPYTDFIGKIIGNNLNKKMIDMINDIIGRTYLEEDSPPIIFIQDIARNKAFFYIQASFLFCIVTLSKPLDKRRTKFIESCRENIFFYTEKYNDIFHQKWNLDENYPIYALLSLKDQIEEFIRISSEDNYINTTISDVISSMFNYYTIKDEKKKSEIRVEEQKRMLSFLTHTLRNSLSAGPQIAKTITGNLKFLLGDSYLENNAAYNTINNATSLLTTFKYVDNLIDTFKLFSNDKSIINKKWENETEGDLLIGNLVNQTLIQTISKILFYESYSIERKQLFDSKNIKLIKESFLEHILVNTENGNQANNVLNWLNNNSTIIQAGPFKTEFNIKNNGIRFGILFSIFSELISNSFSYFDGVGKIEIDLNESEKFIEFTCRNHYNENLNITKGTNKGIYFINHIVSLVDEISFEVSQQNGVWISIIRIKK